jgi:hypothetical protein
MDLEYQTYQASPRLDLRALLPYYCKLGTTVGFMRSQIISSPPPHGQEP